MYMSEEEVKYEKLLWEYKNLLEEMRMYLRHTPKNNPVEWTQATNYWYWKACIGFRGSEPYNLTDSETRKVD